MSRAPAARVSARLPGTARPVDTRAGEAMIEPSNHRTIEPSNHRTIEPSAHRRIGASAHRRTNATSEEVRPSDQPLLDLMQLVEDRLRSLLHSATAME